jgi:DNA replication and repair protein RecF
MHKRSYPLHWGVLLRSLSQLNYRNLSTPRLEFTGGVNALIGPNASGKSNVLEAAYLACTGELPRGKIAETVRLGESEGFIGAKLERQDGFTTVEIGLTPGKKVIRLDGQSVRAFELAKTVAAVLITPEDSELVHGSPSTRRHYLDSLLSKLSLRYALLSREYARVLEQRNAVLRANPAGPGLEVWTQKFLELGSEVTSLRQRATARIAEIARETYAEIAADGKCLTVNLQGSEDLAAALAASRAEEQARGVTVVGPHREDLGLTLGHSLQAYGSRGEARTAALALRVAEYQLLEEKLREAPVLLLDDFSAELDENRRSYLLALVASTPQAIVSGTGAPPQFAKAFDIREGRVRVC